MNSLCLNIVEHLHLFMETFNRPKKKIEDTYAANDISV